jgi:hypothetical protein
MDIKKITNLMERCAIQITKEVSDSREEGLDGDQTDLLSQLFRNYLNINMGNATEDEFEAIKDSIEMELERLL